MWPSTGLELQRLLAEGQPARLVDVRTPGEFATAHVPGAKLIPLGDLDPAVFRAARGAEGTPVYVLCQSGGRARKAIEKLEQAEVHGCVLVEGGTQGWIDAGLPVTRGQSKGLPVVRQVQLIVGFISALGAVLALAADPLFAILPLVMGSGLMFAGVTGTCGMALLLAKMPWNRTRSCGSCCETKGDASSMKKPLRIVIVGGVAGGASAAAKARRLDESADIQIFERGPYVSFANCGLPYFIAGEIDDRAKLIVMTPEKLWERSRVRAHVNHEVLAINRSAKTICVKKPDGKQEDVPYDKLVLSQGAKAIVPPIPGADLPHVFTLRDIPDMDRIAAFINERKPRHAVVVGGGFIGLEMAEAFHHRRLPVTIVERNPHILPLLDRDMAAHLQNQIRQDDFDFRTSVQAVRFTGDGVEFADGSRLPADLIWPRALSAGMGSKMWPICAGASFRPNYSMAHKTDQPLPIEISSPFSAESPFGTPTRNAGPGTRIAYSHRRSARRSD